MKHPRISIITATYNSSHLLRHAIQSVRDSDFQDWELIVVGDCCTDDTGELIRSFADPRISFFNLEQNSGQQAKPNTVGLSKAQGEFIAFLNQDDLFFPDHLGKCVAEIEQSQADFMIIPGIKVLKSTQADFDAGNYEVQLCSVHAQGKFSSNVFSVASTWFLRREVAVRLGGWKQEKDLYVTPSQEWIFRAYQLGVRYFFPNRVGCLIILSGERKNSYGQKFSFEHDFFSKRLWDQDLKAKLMERAAVYAHRELQNQLFFQPKLLVKRVLGMPLDWILRTIKIHPSALRNRMAWGKKGSLIRKVRKDTGL